jgi:hypothetical protein
MPRITIIVETNWKRLPQELRCDGNHTRGIDEKKWVKIERAVTLVML